MELNEWRWLGIGHPPAYGNEKLAHQVIDELRERAEKAEEALAAAEAECAASRKAYENGFGMGKCHVLVGPAMRNDATRARLGLKPIGEAGKP